LGAEQAGHIIFCKDNFRLGDGVLAARVLCAIFKENKELFEDVKKNDWLQVQENIDISNINKQIFEGKNFESLISTFQKSFEKFGRVVVRKSGTEPKLRLLVEGKDLKLCQMAVELLKSQILELV
jgi:phosphoglucosamine mutase